jgi:indole-3-acetate monooxygenase
MNNLDTNALRILDAARALGPALSAASDEIERERHLPPAIVEQLKRAGMFRLAMPKSWGGLELDFPTQVRVIETLCTFDASAGWCVMIGIDGGYITAYIDQSEARAMYRDIDSPTAITFFPPGKALKHGAGYVVNGRWPFGSGCQHADWLVGHFAIFDGDSPRMMPNGFPETRFGFFPAAECEILDTWKSVGLRGSGSHDWQVKDRFIAEERTFNLAAPKPYREGPLNILPNLLLYKLAGVPLGIARGAIDDFVAIASSKALTFKSPTKNQPTLRDEAYAQNAVAQAEALVGSARAFVYETFEEMWQVLASGEMPSLKCRARARLAMVHASATCTQAVEMVYKANGGASVYSGNPLERRLRDIQTAGQHTVVSMKTWEAAGRVLLGLDPQHGMLF